MSERSVCVLDMALYKTLYLSHCVLSCETDCFTICLSLAFVTVLTINEYYYYFIIIIIIIIIIISCNRNQLLQCTTLTCSLM